MGLKPRKRKLVGNNRATKGLDIVKYPEEMVPDEENLIVQQVNYFKLSKM